MRCPEMLVTDIQCDAEAGHAGKHKFAWGKMKELLRRALASPDPRELEQAVIAIGPYLDSLK